MECKGYRNYEQGLVIERTEIQIKSLLFLTIIIMLLSFPTFSFAGSIKGKVNVRGLRSPENILVYLSKAPEITIDLSKTKFVIDQRDLTFIPHVLPILAGSTVHFPNNDKVNHNVFSLSRTKNFNLGSYQTGESRSLVFDKPGIVELRCDVHAEMLAYILVMKNPYWAVTDKKGHFEIPDPAHLEKLGISDVNNLPQGSYFIKTWHKKLKTKRKKVEVPGNTDVTVEIDLVRGTPGVLYK